MSRLGVLQTFLCPLQLLLLSLQTDLIGYNADGHQHIPLLYLLKGLDLDLLQISGSILHWIHNACIHGIFQAAHLAEDALYGTFLQSDGLLAGNQSLFGDDLITRLNSGQNLRIHSILHAYLYRNVLTVSIPKYIDTGCVIRPGDRRLRNGKHLLL